MSENFIARSAAGLCACGVYRSCCDSFVVSVGGCGPPRPRFVRASWVQTSPPHATMELLLNNPLERVGKFDEGAKGWWDILCVSLELLSHSLQESRFITLSPHWQILMSQGPTQLYAMFLSTSDGAFLVNLSVKQSFAWGVTDNWICPTIWVMTLMMTYSRMCHSGSPQLPPALPGNRWDRDERLHKWPSRQGGEKTDFCADGGRCERSLSTTNSFLSKFGCHSGGVVVYFYQHLCLKLMEKHNLC